MENLKVRDKVFYISRGLIYRGKIISIQEDEYTIERIPNKNSIYLMKKRAANDFGKKIIYVDTCNAGLVLSEVYKEMYS